jgi:hypothetical protein
VSVPCRLLGARSISNHTEAALTWMSGGEAASSPQQVQLRGCIEEATAAWKATRSGNQGATRAGLLVSPVGMLQCDAWTAATEDHGNCVHTCRPASILKDTVVHTWENYRMNRCRWWTLEDHAAAADRRPKHIIRSACSEYDHDAESGRAAMH